MKSSVTSLIIHDVASPLLRHVFWGQKLCMKTVEHCRTEYGRTFRCGTERRSELEVRGLPLVHIARGCDSSGRKLVAKGIIAIGQYAVGVIAVGQFCAGFFCAGQFCAGFFCIGQFCASAIAISQFAVAIVAIAQYCVALTGIAQSALSFSGLAEWLSRFAF